MTHAELDAILRPVGFARHKVTWNRRSGDFVDIVDLQRSKSGDMITMNLGVLHALVYRKAWNQELPEFLDEPSSTVRARIGQLVNGKDLWWADADFPVGENLRDLCKRFVLPFLDGLHSVEAMEEQLVRQGVEARPYPLPKIHLALLRFERGDRAGARNSLLELRSKTTEPWRARIDEVLRQLSRD